MKSKWIIVTVFIFVLAGSQALAGRLEKIETGYMVDLNGAAWHPFEDYGLVVGDGVYRCSNDLGSGYELQMYFSSPPAICTAVDWRPQGDYAIIVSQEGYIYKFDGFDIYELPVSVLAPLTDVKFSPNGGVALIVGYGGTVLAYDGETITDYSVNPNMAIHGVSWHPSEDYALFACIERCGYEKIYRWDHGVTTEEWAGSAVSPGGISFHPSGDYALLCAHWGHVAKYNSTTGYEILETTFHMETKGLQSVEWSPDGSVALLAGSWNYVPFPDQQDLIEYNGQHFNVLRNSEAVPEPFEDICWKPDSSAAFVVGESGGLLEDFGLNLK